jgi:hypothetical protein
MTSIVKALIVPAGRAAAPRVETIAADLPTLQGLVGGDIEAVTFGSAHVYLHAEGKILGLKPNLHAAFLLLEAGIPACDLFAGDAVFLGSTPDGDEADVPADLLRIAEDYFETELSVA